MTAAVDYLVLKHHKKDSGTCNDKIRFTLGRSRVYIPTNAFIINKQISNDLKTIKDGFVAPRT